MKGKLKKLKKFLLSKTGAVLLILAAVLLVFSSVGISKIITTKTKDNVAGEYDPDSVFVSEIEDNRELLKYGNSRDGSKIKILTADSEDSSNYLTENTVIEDGYEVSESVGEAGTIESLEKSITDSVLKQVTETYGEVIEGASGAPGKQGEKGDTGATGAKGATGPRGATGAAGLSGKPGKDGTNGEDGEDGKTSFIVYSQYANGMNGGTNSFTDAPTSSTKYMGVALAVTKPTRASDYTWTQYKDLSIEYVNQGKPTIVIK